MSDVEEIVLSTVPSLASSYAGAALGLVRPVRQVEAGSLPDVALVAEAVSVPRSLVAEYARLVGESVRDAVPSVVLHGTAFPLVLALLRRTDFPLPAAGMVHLSNRVEQARAIPVGAPLRVRVHAEGLQAHRKGTAVTLVSTISSDGDEVFVSRSLYLATGVRLLGAPPAEASAPRPTFVPPVPTGRWQLGADTGRRYAAVLGDYNPIHLGSLSAKVMGRPRAIAHGMYLAGRALAGLPAVDGAWGWDVEFLTPVSLPGTVEFRRTGSLAGDGAAGAAGGVHFVGWNARSAKPHFTGNAWVG